MDEVVENTHSFVDILCMARGESVQGWDEQTFHRALKWAQYFEQVHCKLKSKPGLSQKLENYLKNFNKTASIYLGNLELSFSQLANSKQILRNYLLQNPYLSNTQFTYVLKLFGMTIGSNNDATSQQNLENGIVTLMKQKGTLKILSKIRDKLNTDQIPKTEKSQDNKDIIDKTCTTESKTSVDKLSQASMGELLFKYLQHIADFSDLKEKQLITDKLNLISSQDQGIETITTCLLFVPDNCLSHSKAETIRRIVLSWLLDTLRNNRNHLFWHLPPSYLCKLACCCEDLLSLYLDYLTACGNKMTALFSYELSQQERALMENGKIYLWRNQEMPSSHDCMAFEDVVQHFIGLLKGPAHVNELCLKAIKSNIKSYCNQSKTVQTLGINFWKDLYDRLIQIDII